MNPPQTKNVALRNQFHLDGGYRKLLGEIKTRLQKAQLKAAISVNRELVQFYWEIGKLIIEQQKQAKWGDKLFEALEADLSKSFPKTSGFSKTNLKNMRAFAEHYPNAEFGQALPDQLTWTHHVVLLQLVASKDLAVKQWYAVKAVENGWPYRQLMLQIKSDLYARQADNALKTTNFHNKLLPPRSALAQEMIKEPYKFHFLTVGEEAHEKEIQQGLIGHVKQFLMELGHGFSFFGSNHPIHVSGKRFEIDLLFYHTKLHCYFVIEIKRGDFEPEHAGQLNFYLSAVDEQLKMPEDGPTIGLLLCEKKDRVIAEYALRRVESPMGIAAYEFSRSLPQRLHDALPTTDEIEEELNEHSKEPQPLKTKKIDKKTKDGHEGRRKNPL